MRVLRPFQPDDLAELGDFLARADAVVTMGEVADGNHDERVIGLRHDCDNDHSLEVAADMARWEKTRGFRSSYYILHTAPYWQDEQRMQQALDTIAECGHEIGLHLNALTVAIETGSDPLAIVMEALDELLGYGYPVRGFVGHGDSCCRQHNFVNDEVFVECPRPVYGAPDRTIAGVRIQPVSYSEFGLDYNPIWLPRGEYLSDSGGRWSQPFRKVVDGFPFQGQLHLLIHPDWWGQAFTRAGVTC